MGLLAQKRGKKKLEEAEMDITPMIDCTFLLLIFFLVTSKMDEKISVDLPSAKHGATVVIQESIIITVAKGVGEGEIARFFKGDSTEQADLIPGANIVEQEEALTAWIEQQAAGPPVKKYVLIKGEKDVKFRDVHRAEKAAGRADVEKLYVAVMEKDSD
jgi:biopolymer transport protein TolR